MGEIKNWFGLNIEILPRINIIKKNFKNAIWINSLDLYLNKTSDTKTKKIKIYDETYTIFRTKNIFFKNKLKSNEYIIIDCKKAMGLNAFIMFFKNKKEFSYSLPPNFVIAGIKENFRILKRKNKQIFSKKIINNLEPFFLIKDLYLLPKTNDYINLKNFFFDKNYRILFLTYSHSDFELKKLYKSLTKYIES